MYNLATYIIDEENIMCTRTQLSTISKRIAETYRDVYGPSLVGMYLYGSYARGDYDSESDLDYVAIVRGDRLSLQKELDKVREISFGLGLDNDIIVSPTVIPFDEFEKYKELLPYYRNIEKEGISIE